MKQLLILNNSIPVKTGIADDLTVLNTGQIGFFHLSPDASGTNEGKVTFFDTKPTENFGIALGRGANVPAFVIPEVDINTLNVNVTDPKQGNPFLTQFTFPTPVVGKEYGVVIIKKGVVPNERNTWYVSVVAKTTTPSAEATALVKAINDKTNDVFAVTASNSGALISIRGTNIGEGWGVQLVDALTGTAFAAHFPVEAKPNIGDTAYIRDLAQRCAAGKGFVYLDQASKDIYPGYPETLGMVSPQAVENDGYAVFNLRFATKRMSGKTTDEQVWQYVHIAVRKNGITYGSLKTILEQPVLPNAAEEEEP